MDAKITIDLSFLKVNINRIRLEYASLQDQVNTVCLAGLERS